MSLARLLGAALLLLLASTANAQERLLVRSAEHPSYSRLLVAVPQETDWAVLQNGRITTVSFPGLRAGFALDQVFEKMPRTRIVAVDGRTAVVGAALDLTLACSCDVNVSRVGSRFVAIDVSRSSGSPGTASLTPARRQPVNPAPTVLQSQSANQAASIPAEGRSLPNLSASQRVTIEAARDSLISQINRAANQGLVQLRDAPEKTGPGLPQSPPPKDNTEKEAPTTKEKPQSEMNKGAPKMAKQPKTPAASPIPTPKAEKTAQKPMDKPGISLPSLPSLSTSETLRPQSTLPAFADQINIAREEAEIDRQIASRTALDEVTRINKERLAPGACPRDSQLDIGTWGSEETALNQIGALRRNIVSDYGTVDDSVILELARYYIHLGFGREAEMVLAQMERPDTTAPRLLRDMARAMEGRAVVPGGALTAMGSCDGRLALWRVIAGLEPLEPGTERSDNAISAFAELPPELRRLVGPEILRHALEYDGPDHADRVMRILDRTPGKMSAREQLVRARVTAMKGNRSEAVDRIADIENLPDTVDDRFEILMLQAEAAADEARPAPPELVTDLQSLKRLHRGTARAVEIDLMLARIDFRSGRPDTGFLRLQTVAEENPGQISDIRKIAQEGLRSLDPAQMAPAQYLQYAVENRYALDGGREGVDLRNDLVRSMLDFGLPNVAIDLLDALPLLPRQEDRLLHAEAQIAGGDPLKGLRYLEGIELEEAARLRARAYRKLGSLENAFVALSDLAPDDPDRNRLALLTRNLAAIEGEGLKDALQPLNAALEEDAPERAGEDPAPLRLADLQSQLQEASSFRSAVTRAEEGLNAPE